jgi:hypothetical protein
MKINKDKIILIAKVAAIVIGKAVLMVICKKTPEGDVI